MSEPTYEELKAKLEQLEKQQGTRRTGSLEFRVSEKGGVSIYGLGRFPVTLYYEQWTRLLGASGDLGSRLGLDNKWILQAVKAGGNYAEIFERNVGKASPLKLDRGLNATWSKGGLMYAIPFK